MTNETSYTFTVVALIEYPDTQVMLNMLRNPTYQAAQQHRAASLEG